MMDFPETTMSNKKTPPNLSRLIERLAQTSRKPLTSTDLYKRADIRKLAPDVRKVSNALGHLWRRGSMTRVPAAASADSRSKWGYAWGSGAKTADGAAGKAPEKATRTGVKTGSVTAAKVRQPPPVRSASSTQTTKPTVRIFESGEEVVVDMPNLRIVIALKPV
jgi:hypothetical protein